MKIKLLFATVAFIATTMACCAQDYSNLKDFVLKDKADYPKAEAKVLECAKYILTTPLDEKNANRLYSLQFIIRWMEGTPDYSFGIDESIMKVSKSNQSLLGVYMACMTQYVLENKENSKDQKGIKYNAMLMLISYAENINNKVEINKELKKMIKAKKEDKLKEYLNV